MTTPTTRNTLMTAVVQNGYGPPERVLGLAEVERPTPGDDEVLVEVRATSVNTPDWITVTGTPAVLRLRFGPWSQPPPVPLRSAARWAAT